MNTIAVVFLRPHAGKEKEGGRGREGGREAHDRNAGGAKNLSFLLLQPVTEEGQRGNLTNTFRRVAAFLTSPTSRGSYFTTHNIHPQGEDQDF